jgi:hypothetical protein
MKHSLAGADPSRGKALGMQRRLAVVDSLFRQKGNDYVVIKERGICRL